MFINLSNHPMDNWSLEQLTAATIRYGEAIDLPFPAIDPTGDESYIEALVDTYVSKVLELSAGYSATVHLMGEMTFTFALVNKLKEQGLDCVASCTDRCVEDMPDGRKQVDFRFVRFRYY